VLLEIQFIIQAQYASRKMTSTLETPLPNTLDDLQRPEWFLPFARIECHYFYHKAWIREGQILEKAEIDKIRDIPGIYLSIPSFVGDLWSNAIISCNNSGPIRCRLSNEKRMGSSQGLARSQISDYYQWS
jgi:hypothetical protein